MPQPPLLCCQFTADEKCPGICFPQCCNNLTERGEILSLHLEGVWVGVWCQEAEHMGWE